MKLDVDNPNYPEISASTVLSNCEDFKDEVKKWENWLVYMVTFVCFLPKVIQKLPVLELNMIGGYKKIFRKENNHIPKNCAKNVKDSLDKINIVILYKTSRRVRSYMSAHVNESGKSHLLIEKNCKKHKCH